MERRRWIMRRKKCLYKSKHLVLNTNTNYIWQINYKPQQDEYKKWVEYRKNNENHCVLFVMPFQILFDRELFWAVNCQWANVERLLLLLYDMVSQIDSVIYLNFFHYFWKTYDFEKIASIRKESTRIDWIFG